MILPNVDHYRVIEPMYEGVRVILNYRGETYSPAYIQGISGAAFHVGGICPCAPTCTPGIEPVDLVKLFGYQAECLPLFNEEVPWDQPAPDELLDSLIDRIKADIQLNRPVLVWHAFTSAEWDVVAGYDEQEKQFYGSGSYAGMNGYASESWTRPRESRHICPAYGAIFIGEKAGHYDSSRAELDSLKHAVVHAHSQRNIEKLGGEQWVFLDGFLAYERWVEDFRNPEKKRDMGDAYCYGIYRSTHRAAGQYLQELAIKYPKLKPQLLGAAGCFTSEADILDRGENLLWWSSPEGPEAQRNQQVVDLLAAAFAEYRNGIGAIESVLDLWE